ncbi:NADPH-dependent F420 reductase [Solicola gregarius]|uniref:NAD(P)-binding domain-containing protein n=1 Tax=Solicola gregarius TaxID=2908642 RepID=A0AA46TKV8_9ACTN|nr:NAD(P)-binding domain-containing protein [Solicola gregarius]UYM06293.1 NAD(P)-binding domain-containing protein [Solicola gregarius]
MHIGIIGAGSIAEALGSGWVAAGHQVLIGGRNTERAAALAQRLGSGTLAGSTAQAASFGEAILLAVPGAVASSALTEAAPEPFILDGRTIIDCTNALAPDAFSVPPGSFDVSTPAVAEDVARAAGGAPVVKAFNMCAAEAWRDAPRSFDDRPFTVAMCGDDPTALAVVDTLVSDLGLRAVHGGGLRRARLMEAMAAFVMGMWFAGHDARSLLPPLEFAGASSPDD